MAVGYQNIGTPRFYVSILQYFASIGKLSASGWGGTSSGKSAIDLVYINPTSAAYWQHRTDWTEGDQAYPYIYILDDSMDFRDIMPNDNNFAMFLGHTYFGLEVNVRESGGDFNTLVHNYLVNPMEYNGYSVRYDEAGGNAHDIAAGNNLGVQFRQGDVDSTYRLGSFLYGTYYDMPHSPELSLTMTHEYDGIKKQETAGGSTLSYANYHKPPDWLHYTQAWQLHGWDRKYSGRRVWDLSFNYLSDSDVEPKHYHMDASHPDWKSNWFSNVLHYTNGGQLPFIFCPDPSIGYVDATRTIPEFAICKFDMSTFKREQVANGVYNMKVKIRETW